MNHAPVASPFLLIAVVFFGLSLARLVKLFKNELTPFHVVFFLFLCECLTQYYPVVQTSMGEVVQHMSLQGEIFVVVASVSLYLAQFLVRRGGEFKAHRYRVKSLVPLWLLGAAMAAIVVVVFVVNTRRLGMIPMYALVAGEDYTGYSDAFMPFFTPLSWGLGRSLTVLSVLLFVTSELPWKTWVFRNAILLGSTGLAVLCNTLDGLRNNMILPFLIVFLGTSRRFHFPLTKLIVPLIICGVFFCAVGTMRVGKNDWKTTVTISSGNRAIDTVSSWFFTYTEPQIQNLDALIVSDPPINYGLIIVSEMLPGPLKDVLFDMPERAGEYMDRKGLTVHSGLTYRTIYADLYSDFGYVGSLLIGALLFAVSARAYTRAGRNPKLLLIYLILLPGLVFFPLVNWYVGITNLLPFFLLLIIRSHKIRTESESYVPENEEEPVATVA